MKSPLMAVVSVMLCVMLFSVSAGAADPVQLPSPRTEGGKPLMEVLRDRMSARAFGEGSLPAQTLSNLLWAAFGINRPDGRRTAPSARNWQEIEVFVGTAEALFLWDPKGNTLNRIVEKDVRALTGTQAFVKDASVNLVYVADYAKVGGGGAEKDLLVGADAGFISQNVYLFCASEGLVTVVRASIDRETLGKEMKLRPEQKIVLAQSVGWPKSK